MVRVCPTSILPALLLIVESTGGRYPSTRSFTAPVEPDERVYPHASRYPSFSIRVIISCGTWASVRLNLAGSCSSDTDDTFPAPVVPAPVSRYPSSGLTKYIIRVCPEVPKGTFFVSPDTTSPSSSTCNVPTVSPVVTT